MNRRCVCRVVSILLILAVIAGCASNGGEQQDLEKTPITQAKFPDVEKAREYILFGSPEALLQAYELLLASPGGKSPEGQLLTYVSEQFMSVLYPLIAFEAGVSLTPANSVYPEIFRDVKKGEFSVLLQDWDSPMLLNAVSCAALFTEEKDVLTLCGAAAQAADRNIENSDSVIPSYILGTIALKREEPKKALTYFEESYELDNSVYPAKWEAAKILRSLNENGEAVLLLQELTESFPDVLQFQFELADCYREMELWEEALQVIGGIDISNDAEKFDMYLDLKSRIEEQAGRIESAVETIEQLQRRNPEDLSILKRYGMLLIKNGNLEKGIAVLELALEEGLEDPEADEILFRYYAEGEEWEKAGRLIDRLSEQPADPDLLSLIAETYLRLERFEEAEETAARLAAEEQRNAEYLSLYARILIAVGKLGPAEEVLQTALDFSVSRQQRSRLYYLLSLTREGLKAKTEMLQNALFENMENVEALLEIASLYRGVGDVRKAYRYIKQAAVLAPDNNRVMNLYYELEGLVGD